MTIELDQEGINQTFETLKLGWKETVPMLVPMVLKWAKEYEDLERIKEALGNGNS